MEKTATEVRPESVLWAGLILHKFAIPKITNSSQCVPFFKNQGSTNCWTQIFEADPIQVLHLENCETNSEPPFHPRLLKFKREKMQKK